jgi:uncharacterized protein YfaS (alpha-2-macroglobulin family)
MSTHRRRYLAAAIAALLLIPIPGCKKKSEGRLRPAAAADVKGELSVIHLSPKGPTEAASETDEVLVVFDHPMAPLEALPVVERDAGIVFRPRLEGTFRWMGTRTLSFKPRKRLPNGTEFQATIPAGMRSVDGFVLKEEVRWSFMTPRPRLVHHLPENRAQQLRLDTDILLVFNQPVEPAKAGKFLAMTGLGPDGLETAVAFSLKNAGTEKLKGLDSPPPSERTLLVIPDKKLTPGFAYAVEVQKGFRGAEGSMGSEKSVLFTFETYKDFACLGLAESGLLDPGAPLKFRFSNRVLYRDFVAKARFEPAVEIPDYYSSWDHGSTTLYLTLPLQPETKYAVILPADAKDDFGNSLEKEVRLTFETGSFRPSLRMTSGQGVLEAYGDRTYPLVALNATRARLLAACLDRDRVVPLLESEKVFTPGEPSRLEGISSFTETSLSFHPPRNVRQVVPLRAGDFLPSPHGFLYLQLDTFAELKWDRYFKAFLQVTELGLTGKFSPDKNLVWVTELRTGQPVADADLEIRDEANAVRWTGRTDGDGKALSPGWMALGLRPKDAWSKPVQWVFARRGEDVAVLSSDWGTGLDPYRFAIDYDWNPLPERLAASLFTERGLYRAGETVHVKGILRQNVQGRWRIPAVKTVEYAVQDPFQKTLTSGRAGLDVFGSFAADVETREDAALGTYTISVKVPPASEGEKETKISETFRVEAFRPAEFEVHLKTLKDAYIFGETYQADIRANFLYGGAMAGQSAHWTLRLNPTSFSPPGHPGFVFGAEFDSFVDDEGIGAERSRLISSGEGQLGPDGRLAVKTALVPEKEIGSVSVTLEATVQSPSRKSISNRLQTIVHRGDYYIGLRPVSTFLKKGEDLSVQAIASAADGTSLSGKKLAVKLIRREWRSVRKAGVGGRFEWLSEKYDTDVDSRELKTGLEPVEIVFQPPKSGLYVLSASGRDGRDNALLTTAFIYVTGRDYVPWERRDDDALDLVADAERYRPGDKARILVKSPYETAKALVTLEREGLLETKVLDMTGSSSEIEVPVTADHIPNIFVSVLLVQGRAGTAGVPGAEDVGKPSFKLGYVNLSVDPLEKRLAVDILPDRASYQPKEKVRLRLKTRNGLGDGVPSSLAVAVVDLGVLNLIGYRTPNPFDEFYGERPLSVQTSESRLHVVGQRNYAEKGENVGGGGISGAGAAGAFLSEVELRGDFKSTAYWNPSILTDSAGEATLEFTLPDNLTTFRIMAVAQTQDSLFGWAAADIKVAKPLLLLPSVPRFVRVGDQFEAGVVVHNNSDRKARVTVSFHPSGLVSTRGQEAPPLMLDAGASREVLFPLEAGEPGRATLAFKAFMDPDTDGLEVSFPVLLPRPTESVAVNGETSGERREERIATPAPIFPDTGSIEIRASASALTGLSGAVDYLVRYPYPCLEQRLSAALPFLVAPRVIRDYQLSPLTPDEIRRLVVETIREAYACQKDNGGFGLWPDSPKDVPFVSCYAVFALLEARRAGYDIDVPRLENGLAYLRNTLRLKPGAARPYGSSSFKTTQAFALYLLALSGRSEPAYNERLLKEREALTLFGRACLLKAWHFGNGNPGVRDLLVQELLNKIKVTPTRAYFEEPADSELGWIYTSNIRTTAIILQTLVEIGAEHPLLSNVAKGLVAARAAGRWMSTQENFFVFYALNEFYEAKESVRPDFKATIRLAEKVLLEESFQAAGKTVRKEWPLSGFHPGQEWLLTAEKSGPGTLYYDVRMTYTPTRLREPRDEGLAVYKKITSLDGRPLDQVKAGTLVLVTLDVAVPKESLFVVVDDPLPGGFEAVNGSFLTESEEGQAALGALSEEEEAFWWRGFRHVELRDDRVLLFADSLMPGVHTHRYLARALTPGRFGISGTKAEEMYAPEVFGRTGERLVTIVK